MSQSTPLSDDARSLQGAARLQQVGRLFEAAERCEALLRRQPGHAAARQLLGVIHVQQGRLDSGLSLLGAVVAERPADPEARNNFGMALQAAGRQAEAAAEFERAAALRPRYAVALNNLGNALDALDRREEAISRYRDALAAEPRYAAACNNLGAALMKDRRLEEALIEFRRALTLRPDFGEARLNLGGTLNLLKRHEEAAAAFRQALARQPDRPEAHLGLGRALQGLDCHREAIEHYREAIRLRPRLGEAHAALGLALQEVGEAREAGERFETALRLEPRRPAHYFNLAGLGRITPDDGRIAVMLALAEDASLSTEEQSALHFALGKALADAGDEARAFEHLMRGNALHRSLLSYNEANRLELLRRIEDVFTPDLVRRGLKTGGAGPAPVFIVGMPRSGSTLIEQILAAHPLVFAAGELEAFRDAERAVGRSARFPDNVPTLSEADLGRIARSYLERVAALSRRRLVDAGTPERRISRITDKMPANFRYAGLIRMALPQARIIHTVRDPVDTCLSCFAIRFERQPFSFDLGEVGRYYRAYAALMDHWRAVLPQDAILDVRYEALVNDLENEARRIVAWCGLEWDDACLRFHDAARPVRTASALQVRRPLYRTSVGRWRSDTATLAPLLEGLGMDGAADASVAKG
jgi:tetratricopeptide (TPR) repeat protein